MKWSAKRIFKIFFTVLISVLYLLGIYLLFATITEYQPRKLEDIALQGTIADNRLLPSEFTLLSWNIGYAGLSREMNSFNDGGKMVKPTLEIYQKSLNGILNTLVKYSYVDFMFLQEVDVLSNRSYYSNQKDFITDFLPDFASAFTVNYDAKYVLMPFYNPMGRVKAGLQTLTKYKPTEIHRHAYSAHFEWPKKLLMPARCFLTTKYMLENGKQLIVVNTNHSTFDYSLMCKNEMAELKDYVTGEYHKGNYIIAGGDWNNNPPGFKKVQSFKNNKIFYPDREIPADFIPTGWKWVYDSGIPTKRKVNEAYNPKTTKSTVIDFYLISPNIESLSIRTLDLNFEFSDHNPVLINIQLK